MMNFVIFVTFSNYITDFKISMIISIILIGYLILDRSLDLHHYSKIISEVKRINNLLLKIEKEENVELIREKVLDLEFQRQLALNTKCTIKNYFLSFYFFVSFIISIFLLIKYY